MGLALNPIEINGKKIKTEVNQATGTFSAVEDGVKYKANTLAELKDKLKRASKKHALPIIRVNLSRGTVEPGVVTGIHGGTGNVQIKYDGEKGSAQASWVSGNEVFLPGDTTKDVVQNLIDLAKTSRAAEQDLINAKKKVAIGSLKEWTKKQLEEDPNGTE